MLWCVVVLFVGFACLWGGGVGFSAGRIGDALKTLPEEAPDPSAAHTVKPGETLGLIARAHGLEPTELAQANGIRNPDRLYVGQVLSIPEKSTHTVAIGETLSNIGALYEVSVTDLVLENGISNPDFIRPGQTLAIPKAGAQTALASRARTNTVLCWPLYGAITSVFGMRWGRPHNGIDIAGDIGDSVRASSNGVVSFAGQKGGFGNLVVLEHYDGLTTFYGHLSHIGVKDGMHVLTGETLGLVGSSGNSTGPHLHFELRRKDVPIDPRPLLP